MLIFALSGKIWKNHMREGRPTIELVDNDLGRLNREILELENEIAELQKIVDQMERGHRASVRPETDDLTIMRQILREDAIKDKIRGKRGQLEGFKEKKELLESQKR